MHVYVHRILHRLKFIFLLQLKGHLAKNHLTSLHTDFCRFLMHKLSGSQIWKIPSPPGDRQQCPERRFQSSHLVRRFATGI